MHRGPERLRQRIDRDFSTEGDPWLLVWNKCDLKPEHPEAKENEIYVSATEKIEIEALKEKIAPSARQKKTN